VQGPLVNAMRSPREKRFEGVGGGEILAVTQEEAENRSLQHPIPNKKPKQYENQKVPIRFLSILAGSLSFVGAANAMDIVIDGSYEVLHEQSQRVQSAREGTMPLGLMAAGLHSPLTPTPLATPSPGRLVAASVSAAVPGHWRSSEQPANGLAGGQSDACH